MIALEKNDLTRTFHDLGKEIIDTFGRPKAILSLSAHWYTRGSHVQSSPFPPADFRYVRISQRAL